MSKRKHNRSRLPKSIVVGVDTAGLADDAIRAALDLGHRIGCKVGLVHAVPTPPMQWPGLDPMRSAAFTSELLANTWKTVNARVQGLARAHEGAELAPFATGATAVATTQVDDVRVIPGPPAQVILEEARRKDADVIFLGRHEKRGALDFGSTARAVLAKAPTAVWVQPGPKRTIRRILVPIDLSEESWSALATACGLARVLGAEVQALHVFSISTYAVAPGLDYPGMGPAFPITEMRSSSRLEFEKRIADFEWNGVEHTAEFQDGEPAQKLLELAPAFDLIVMGTHGRTGLASVVLGNVAYAVLRRSETPVLAIRHPERRFLS